MAAAKKLLLIFSKRDDQLLNHLGLPITDSCPLMRTNKKNFVLDTYLLLRISYAIQNNPAAYGGYVFHMSFQDDDKKFLYAILQKGDSANAGTECDADDLVADKSCVRNDGWDGPAENDAHDPRDDWAPESERGLPDTLEKPDCHEAVKQYESALAACTCAAVGNGWGVADSDDWGVRTCHAHPVRNSEASFTHVHSNPLRPNRTHKHTKLGAQGYAVPWNTLPRTEVPEWVH
ncbi:hypothetical protein N8T08_000088 [Aspergillus melleus]|uniref:Uncharacterized protein n=1 Tax=Aspergillus melleus TaxID=138277 RepID=A0ACC3BHH4_9EURO|nr:hypothetical protein N8T08_000088 [Aspergillus melleus]